MKSYKILIATVFAGSMLLNSCGSIPGLSGSDTNTTTTDSNASSTETMLSGIIGQFLGGLTSESMIQGTWVYEEPAIQFESENLLAQAGGSLASTSMVNKINPYFKAIGITKGKLSLTFNSDNTCSYTINGNTYNGTYVFDKSKKTVTISSTLFTFPSAYVSASVNTMALTFDSTKLLTLTQGIGNSIPSATINTISSLSSSFKGMKTGFMFKKK